LGEQDKWREVVQVRKRKDHFIFTIESTGAMAPQELFLKALEILKQKCSKLVDRL
jgi:DNA-directed RNA polymerase I and III subunit RPAC1